MSETTGIPVPPEPPRRRHARRNVLIAGFAAAALIGAGVGVALGASGGTTPVASTTTKVSTTPGVRAPETQPPVSVTDPDGGVCNTSTVQADGYCPGDSPSPSPAATTAPAAAPAPSPAQLIADTAIDVAACQQWEYEQDGLQTPVDFMAWMDENSGTGDGPTTSTGMDQNLITDAAGWFVDMDDPSETGMADLYAFELGDDCLSIGA